MTDKKEEKDEEQPKGKKLTIADILPSSWAKKDSEMVVTVDGKKVERRDVTAK